MIIAHAIKLAAVNAMLPTHIAPCPVPKCEPLAGGGGGGGPTKVA
jgi:hypothetical protein